MATREESPNQAEQVHDVEMRNISVEIELTLLPVAIDFGKGQLDPIVNLIDNPPAYLTRPTVSGTITSRQHEFEQK